jgi:hypothetical protein
MANVAFWSLAGLTVEAVRLREARDVLARMVIADGFDVPVRWLA